MRKIMRTTIRKLGNSKEIIIPVAFLTSNNVGYVAIISYFLSIN